MLRRSMLSQNPENHMDPIWRMRMQTLMKRKRNMEIAQTIDDALYEHYSELGLPVPNWKRKKDPQWWIDYLKSLGLTENNEFR